MRAAFYERNGPARDVLQLGEIETPQPGPGEVRVRLAFSGVNPSDVKSRAGTARKIAFPRVVPHSDGAGTIDLVGDGVPSSRIAERVWLWNGQWKRPFGTCAEYIVVPDAMAVPLPAGVSLEAGACLGIPAMTAHHAVMVANATPGTTVLIAGGAGAVGHYAIQFAKAAGATVITTVSSTEKAEVARAAGADHAIDYKRENVGERVMEITAKRGVDAVIELDLTTNAKLLPGVLRPRGTAVIYGTQAEAQLPAQWLLVNAITLRFIFVYELTVDERAAAIGAINGMLADGKLINTVAEIVPLSDIVAAHEMVEQGKAIGNILVGLS